jgi:hypothetical protein
MIFGFYCLFAWLLMIWTRLEILNQEQKTNWVRELLLEGQIKSPVKGT